MIDNSKLKVGDNVWIRSVYHNWSGKEPEVDIHKGIITKVTASRIYVDVKYLIRNQENTYKIVFEFRKTRRLIATDNYSNCYYSLFSSEEEVNNHQKYVNDKRESSKKLKKEFDSKVTSLTLEKTLKLLEYIQKL